MRHLDTYHLVFIALLFSTGLGGCSKSADTGASLLSPSESMSGDSTLVDSAPFASIAHLNQSPTYKIETDELTLLKDEGVISDAELAELKNNLKL